MTDYRAMEVRKYKKPPVTERVISMGFVLDEESFQRRLDSWNGIMKQTFPEAEIATHWEVLIADKNGIPYIPTDKQKITTKYRFWRGKQENRDRGLQIWRDRIAFNLLSALGEPKAFQDLLALYTEWAPEWADHFNIRAVAGVTIEYVNVIAKSTVPKFCDAGRIDIGRILTTFPIPGPFKKLVSPLAYEFNFECSGTPTPMTLHTKLSSLPAGGVALRLEFRASSEVPNRQISLDSVPAEIETAHRVIVDQFEAFFTDEAKASFEPL